MIYRLVEDLQTLGINVSDIKKLQDAGLHTIGGKSPSKYQSETND